MVQLTSYLNVDAVALDVTAVDKASLLREAGVCLARVLPGVPAQTITDLLVAREKVASTGVGEGIAIPHATCDAIDVPRLGLLRTSGPVEFDAVDQQPVRLVMVVLAPKNAQALHLRLLARIARLVRSEQIRGSLFAAQTPAEAFAVIDAHEAGLR